MGNHTHFEYLLFCPKIRLKNSRSSLLYCGRVTKGHKELVVLMYVCICM